MRPKDTHKDVQNSVLCNSPKLQSTQTSISGNRKKYVSVQSHDPAVQTILYINENGWMIAMYNQMNAFYKRIIEQRSQTQRMHTEWLHLYYRPKISKSKFQCWGVSAWVVKTIFKEEGNDYCESRIVVSLGAGQQRLQVRLGDASWPLGAASSSWWSDGCTFCDKPTCCIVLLCVLLCM